jgi:DNA mismatch repair protein MutS
MLRQYRAIKSRHPDCILFFRLGDFYEMFCEDAQTASRELDLTLTARGKGTAHRVPMCGFPYHAADNYIGRLVKSGHKVAICDQTEDPAAARGLVKRDIVRVITAGTYLDENSPASRYLVALCPGPRAVGISFTDPAQGIIQANEFSLEKNRVAEIIAGMPARECIFPESSREKLDSVLNHPLLRSKGLTLSPWQDWAFNPEMARKTLCDHFGVSNLRGFGIEELSQAAAASGALLDYLRGMNRQPLRHIDKIRIYSDDEYVAVPPAARRGLEIDTLIKTLDETVTAAGKRRFANWFYHPLKNSVRIAERQRAVTALKDDRRLGEQVRDILKKIPDLEKTISRLGCGYTHARDLLAVRNTLGLIPELKLRLDAPAVKHPLLEIPDITPLREHLLRAVNEDIPLARPEGKIVREGYHVGLDELRNIQENGRQWLREFQAKEIKRTGITSLKVGFNNVFGYYLEVSRANAGKVPADYVRKQTLVNGERYITDELKQYEDKILTAEDQILQIEAGIVKALRQDILDHSAALHGFCEALATVDTLGALAALARRPGYILPEVDTGTALEIRDGRHPVVEKNLPETFIANDTFLDSEGDHLIILTGPNMAGKSTWIRQTALLTIMAQTGSYIPAASARIGVVDKVFTRIGAHDDIARGQSTFMVEMNETADILNNMTGRSLLVFDEIGRGTSTCDGLSLAWALAEHLAATKARALFATHFHEITALADKNPGVRNYNVAVKEWKDKIIFMHKIVPGGTDDSYGIYVARLAGIPDSVIRRSREILTQLEIKNDIRKNLAGNTAEEQLNLFESADRPGLETIHNELRALDPDNLTPLAALQKLREWKDLIDG